MMRTQVPLHEPPGRAWCTVTAPSIQPYTEGYLFARLVDWSPLIAAPGRLAAAS